MCEKCEEVKELKENENILVSEGEIVYTYFKPQFEYSDDRLNALANTEDYMSGELDASYLAGFFNSLSNMGVPIEIAVSLTIQQQTLNHNTEIQKMNVEISKNNSETIENTQL